MKNSYKEKRSSVCTGLLLALLRISVENCMEHAQHVFLQFFIVKIRICAFAVQVVFADADRDLVEPFYILLRHSCARIADERQ